MNEIPNDIMEKANKVMLTLPHNDYSYFFMRDRIAKAISEERERCIKAATEMNERLLGDSLADSINGYVDDAIRNGGEK